MIYFLILFIIGGLFFTMTPTGKNLAASIGETVSEQVQNISDYTISLVAGFEGFSATPYKDVDKIAWGYGHNQLPGEEIPIRISEAEAKDLLLKDIAKAASAIDSYVNVPISENQRNALISLVYNIGVNAFENSTLLRKLNAGDAWGAADEFDKWVHAEGKISNVLVARRETEKELFLS